MITKTVVLDNIDAASGYINRSSIGVYTVYVGTNVVVGDQLGGRPNNTQRGFFSFDTQKVLPTGARILKIELFVDVTTTSSVSPPDWKIKFFMGTFIGAALDWTDWGGGTGTYVSIYEENWSSPTTGWYDLTTSKSKLLFNRNGKTDFCIEDTSASTSPNSWQFASTKKTYFQLRVTYVEQEKRFQRLRRFFSRR